MPVDPLDFRYDETFHSRNLTLLGQIRDGISSIIGDINYTFHQGVADTVWIIQHNLNKNPSVTIVDSMNTAVTGSITYNDLNTLTITFNAAMSGKAYLN